MHPAGIVTVCMCISLVTLGAAWIIVVAARGSEVVRVVHVCRHERLVSCLLVMRLVTAGV